MQRLRILGTRHTRVFYENNRTELKAVSDLDFDKVQEIGKLYNATTYQDSSKMLEKENLDAVAIATPDHVHGDLIMNSLKKDNHVIVEKPLTTDIESAKKIVYTAKKYNKTVMVNYSQRFVTDFKVIKEKIKDGLIGQPQMVQSEKFDTIQVPTKMIDWASKTSPFFFMTSHDLDLVCWFLDAKPTEVYAQEVSGVLKERGINTHDGVQSIIRFNNGVSSIFHSSWIHPTSYPTIAGGSLKVIGSKGFLRYSMLNRELNIYSNETTQTINFSGLHTADIKNERIRGAFTKAINHFLDNINQGKDPDTSAINTLHVTLCQCAVLESIRKNKPIKI